MRSILFILSLLVASTIVKADGGNNGRWTVYSSYHNASKCVCVGSKVYVLSYGGLFSYDSEDSSVETYTRANALSDNAIADIVYCRDAKELVIVYSNGNIDLMDDAGEVYNITDLKLKTLSDKSINDLYVDGGTVYFSLGSGIMLLDVKKRLVRNFYNLGYHVNSVMIEDGMLYAATKSGVFRGRLADNLLDASNWTKISSLNLTKLISFSGDVYAISGSGLLKIGDKEKFSGVSVVDKSIFSSWNEIDGTLYVFRGTSMATISSGGEAKVLADSISYMEKAGDKYWAACGTHGLRGYSVSGDQLNVTVGSIIPESPIRNYASFLRMEDGGRLLIAGGIFSFNGQSFPGTLMKYEGGKFTSFDEEGPISLVGSQCYRDITDVVQDPQDPEHHFCGSVVDGIYEFKNYKMVGHYDHSNSPLATILPNDAHPERFVRVTGVEYDANHNLWMLNNETDTLVRVLKNDGSWAALYYDELANNPSMDHILFDKNGWAWINSRRRTNNGYLAGVFCINTNGNLNSTRGHERRLLTDFTNQDNTTYTVDLVSCITQDLNGTMWFGTDKGLFMNSRPETFFSDEFRFHQVKVPRNDGSGLADYLLTNVGINCVTIDGGNRKWIGTAGNGVYLISADGLEQLAHFTTENSPLVSDNISDIAINGETGEVFFATEDQGLVSYVSDATDPVEKMERDNIKIYPNPVRPDYTGRVSITGLSYDSNVKIVNAAGRLIHEGTSSGGQYSWDLKNKAGKRCGSGVYYVLATNSEGKNGVAQKFVIIK